MGIDAIGWHTLVQYRKATEQTLLCLGYPDLLVSEKQLLESMPALPPLAKDWEEVASGHSWRGKIFDTTEALRKIGYNPKYIDIVNVRGIEHIVDLNKDIFESLPYDHPISNTRFDMVAEIGRASCRERV